MTSADECGVETRRAAQQEESFSHRADGRCAVEDLRQSQRSEQRGFESESKVQNETWHTFLKSTLWRKQVSLSSVLNDIKSV